MVTVNSLDEVVCPGLPHFGQQFPSAVEHAVSFHPGGRCPWGAEEKDLHGSELYGPLDVGELEHNDAPN